MLAIEPDNTVKQTQIQNNSMNNKESNELYKASSLEHDVNIQLAANMSNSQ